MLIKGDFHMHSTCSDGNLSPAELVRYAKKRKVDIIALTDHNSCDGLYEAISEGKRSGIVVIPAVELSTKYKENRVHIIIGGAFQGKTQYATKIYPELGLTDGINCSLDEIRNCVAINKFNSFTRRWLLEGKTKEALLTILENNRSLQLLISDEIGYGLVPIDDFEREYREFHGRVMTELAEQADCVERIVCGIPQRIK